MIKEEALHSACSGIVTIENSSVKASIRLLGAELIEWTSKDSGINHLWTESGWPNTAPILFPIIGNLARNTYTYEGQEYQLSRHGFARNSMFEILEQQPNQVILVLNDNEGTRSIYPFPFHLKVIFRLEGEALLVKYEVANIGCKPMLFSLGSHPAFNYTESAFLEFESLSSPFEGDNGFIDFLTPSHVNYQNNIIALDDYDFKKGPLYFRDIKAQTIRLKNADTIISMSIPNVPFLGLWKKPECDFICIEPWYGITSKSADKIERLEDKEGMICLEVNESFSTEYQLQAMYLLQSADF